MEAVINFLNEYGILSMVITAVVGAVGTALGLFAKWLYNKTIGEKIKEETKEKIAAIVVKYVEQVWSDLHGEDKLNKALEAFSEMLASRYTLISRSEIAIPFSASISEKASRALLSLSSP